MKDICRVDPTRTGDHLVPNQTRYQLRHYSIIEEVGFKPTTLALTYHTCMIFCYNSTDVWLRHYLYSLKCYALSIELLFYSCGDRTRTCDLLVMSQTSYQLPHSAMYDVDFFKQEFLYTYKKKSTFLDSLKNFKYDFSTNVK